MDKEEERHNELNFNLERIIFGIENLLNVTTLMVNITHIELGILSAGRLKKKGRIACFEATKTLSEEFEKTQKLLISRFKRNTRMEKQKTYSMKEDE